MAETNNELKNALQNIKQPLTLLDLNFQKKLIKVIIEDKNGEFSSQIIDILKTEYFEGIYAKTLVKYIMGYVEKWNIIPEYETIRDVIQEKEQEGTLKTNLLEMVTTIEEQRITDKPNVKNFTLNFCRKQSLKNGLLKAFDQWNQGEYDDISHTIQEALKIGETKNIGHNYIKDVEKRLIKTYRSPITFMKGIDPKIGGGLAGGELGIILSPTGGGKSMMLVMGAVNASKAGKTVVYYTFELSENSVSNRIDSALTGVPIKDILEYPDVVREAVLDLTEKGGNIITKEFGTGSASVNTLRAHLKVLERSGVVPDIIFVDYADVMKAISHHSENRHALQSIYTDLRGLAMELNIPCWSACQTNRSGMSKDKFGLETISESIGKAQVADIVLGLARSDEDKLAKKANLMFLKNRNGEDGYTIPLHFDTTKMDIRVLDADNTNLKVGLKGLNIEAQIRANNVANPVIV